jgi:murein DD-endopeptidase MepM/ murein hydrolase activator NlpD
MARQITPLDGRSQQRCPYAQTQAARARGGAGALAGNHVILRLEGQHGYVVLTHLRSGSLRVDVGARVVAGEQLATFGNSGNSTQPHVHVQVMDTLDPLDADGLPMVFENYRVWPGRGGSPERVGSGIPRESDVVEPL